MAILISYEYKCDFLILKLRYDLFLGMVLRKALSKFQGENNGFEMMRGFDNLKFTILTYFCFGAFFMAVMGKISDLQAQIRTVELEVRDKSAEIGSIN